MHTDRWQHVIERHGRAVAGIILAIGGLGVRSWVVTPHVASLKAAQQYERATGHRIEKSETINHQLRAKRTHLEKLRTEYALMSEMTFEPAKAEAFLGSLGVFCEHRGCVVTSLSFINDRNETDDGRGSSVVARGAALTVQGRYGSIAGLIEELQGNREKVWIDEFHMARLPSHRSRVTCQMRITIYVNLDEETVGYEHSPIPQ